MKKYTTPVMDAAIISYEGNRLSRLDEYGYPYKGLGYCWEEEQFAYNRNAALTKDAHRGIDSIRYNYMNLPQKIWFDNGNYNEYLYDATGTKRRVTYGTMEYSFSVPGGTGTAGQQSYLTTDYCGSVIYENGQLSRVLNPEGYTYFVPVPDTYIYYYFTKDYQGSVRAVTQFLSFLQGRWPVGHTDYYPYGLPFGEEGNPEHQPYKREGKELDEMHGLNWYDQGARFFGSDLPVTPTMDPLAEKYYGITPYAQWANNPVRYVDPDGMDWYQADNGNIMWRRSQDKEYEDDDGNKWSNIGEEYMMFNGRELTYFQQGKNKDGELTLSTYSYEAVSGKPLEIGSFSYSDESQATKGGPIPEGEYYVWAQDVQKFDDLSKWDKFKSNFGGSVFPGGTDSWGNERTWIYPKSVSATNPATGEVVERTNMSIHGGTIPGSRGCIDLHVNAPRFFNHLRQSSSTKAIYMTVRYPSAVKK